MSILLCQRALTLLAPHEIGYAMGLEDCYSFYTSEKNGEIEWTNILGIDEPVDGLTFVTEHDWWSVAGRGFYGLEDSRREVFRRLLMFGYDDPNGVDIPSGRILGLMEGALSSRDFKLSQVGADGFKKTDEEVFTK